MRQKKVVMKVEKTIWEEGTSGKGEKEQKKIMKEEYEQSKLHMYENIMITIFCEMSIN
jgi:hypothetical protein